jgi:hypothetical protein
MRVSYNALERPRQRGGLVLGSFDAMRPRSVVHRLSFTGLALALFSLAPDGRAHSLEAPLPEASSGLLSDLERIVDAEESAGWFLDEDALRSIRKAVLESVCRTPEPARRAALSELERRHEAVGDARALYERKGNVLDGEVENALFLERQLLALRVALDRAPDECPFWIAPEPDFPGRQTDRHRFTLNLESGGSAQVRATEGTWTLGGGGLARVLAGYGLDGRFTVLAGVEFGGGAMIKPRTEPTELVINYFPAIPLVLRVHHVAWHYDFETAPVALFQADNGEFSFGARAAFGVGLSALRTRGVVPWGGAHIAYEYYAPSGGRAAQYFVRGGLRVGFVWDP